MGFSSSSQNRKQKTKHLKTGLGMRQCLVLSPQWKEENAKGNTGLGNKETGPI
jgi:hypothetical protein